MFKINALVLQKKDDYRKELESAVLSVDPSASMRFENIEYLENIDSHAKFNLIILISDKSYSRFAWDGITDFTSLCVIQMIPGEGEGEVVMKDGYLFEEIPLNMLLRHRECFLHIIRKNMKILEKFQEERLLQNMIIGLMPDGILIVDIEGKIITSNARLSGFTLEEIKGRSIMEFIYEKDRERVRGYMKESLVTGESKTFKTKIITKSGELLPIEATGKLIFGVRGNPLYFLAILTNIQDKQKLWETEQFSSHMIKTSRDGIIGLDENFSIKIWNQGAQKILGYSQEEIMGKDIHLLIGDEDEKEKWCQFYQELQENRSVDKVFMQLRDKNGTQQKIELSANCLYDDEENIRGIFAIFRELTGVTQELNNYVKRSEEMEHIINMISHDLRSPLHSIGNYISLIRESTDKENDDELQEMFHRVSLNLSNMENMLKDLTNFSRAGLQSTDKQVVDITEMVDEVVSNIQWQVGKGNFKVDIGHLPIMEIDPMKIRQVFENLISNTYKFRKDGSPCEVIVESARSGDFFEFRVQDNGIGIGSNHKDKIFNLFYRSKEKVVEGTGAGLAITKKIIRSYGGNIWVESEPGKGSTFFFTLPANLQILETV